ncbi:MAG: hypothetical protein ACOC0M_00105 [Halomonas sp.]
MILYLLNRAMWVVIVAALIGAVMLLNVHDQRHEQAALEAYCESVATWQAEAARGIRPEHRTGHPDYDEIAADECSGLRPAGTTTERQLAQE